MAKVLFIIFFTVYFPLNRLLAQSERKLQICCVDYDQCELSFAVKNEAEGMISVIVPSALKKNGIDVIKNYTISKDTLAINFLNPPGVSSSGKVNYIIDGDYYLQRNINSNDTLRLLLKIKKGQYRKVAYIKINMPVTNETIIYKNRK